MVMIRCPDHPPDERLYEWVVAVEPVGYPDTAVVCGYRTHGEAVPGLAYLTGREHEQFQRGRRVFSLAGSATQVRLADSVRKGRAVALSRPPEPSAGDLEAAEAPSADAPTDPRPLTRSVRSYLWSEGWGETLADSGLAWERFVCETAAAGPAVQEWADGARTWEEVLDGCARALGLELEDE